MVVRVEQGTIERGFAAVKAYAGPRLLEPVTQIVLARNEVDCPGSGFVRDHKIHKGIQRLFPLLLRDLGQSLAVVFLQIGIHNSRYDDSRSASAPNVDV